MLSNMHTAPTVQYAAPGDSPTNLLELPSRALELILNQLDSEDVKSFALTCRQGKEAADFFFTTLQAR